MAVETKPVWGLLAEYREPEELMEAAERAKDNGFTKMDAYTPFPVHGINELLGQKKTKLQWLVLLCGILGGTGGFFMQWFASVVDNPWNIGGRPLNSWPSFMPVSFELTILFAALGAVLGMTVSNGLPKPYHPVFNVKEFSASQDKFYLCIEAEDKKFELHETKKFLQSLKPNAVYEVEP